MSVKLIIFDLDGTLVNTIRDITNALNYALTSVGRKPITVDEAKHLVGEGITRLIEKIIGDNGVTERDEIIKKFLSYYGEHLVEFSYIYPNVTETLEVLKEYRKAVISNKRESLSRQLLEKLDLLRYFDIVVGGDTAPERKPSPVPVRHVLKQLQVRPEDAVIVGDSNFDIEAGKKSGVRTVAVTYGFRDRQYLTEANDIIDDMGELPALLDRSSFKLI
jgi:phosphoglycolate phosphatase